MASEWRLYVQLFRFVKNVWASAPLTTCIPDRTELRLVLEVSSNYRVKLTAMRISELSDRSGVNAETVRYYERIGLVPAPPRTASGYRRYGESHVRRLQMVRRSRELGFSIDEIRALIGMSKRSSPTCLDAKDLARRQLAAIDARIVSLRRLRCELHRIVDGCTGTDVQGCRIIDALVGGSAAERR